MRIPGLAIPLSVVLLGVCAPVARAADEPTRTELPPAATEQKNTPPADAPAQPVAPTQSEPMSPAAAEPAAAPPNPPSAEQPAPQTSPVPTQSPAPPPANDQVIEPQVERRQFKIPHIPSNNFEFGIFGGAYNTENFGTNAIGGARLGYVVTEDIFVEAAYGQTKVSDATYRQFLPGGIFPVPEETLRYYDLSAGYNLLPGEFFIGRSHAKVATLYVIAGLGITKFDAASHETINVGFGTRVFLADWAALQVDLRDHAFSLDILGQRKDTQNIELTAGVTFFF